MHRWPSHAVFCALLCITYVLLQTHLKALTHGDLFLPAGLKSTPVLTIPPARHSELTQDLGAGDWRGHLHKWLAQADLAAVANLLALLHTRHPQSLLSTLSRRST